MSQFYLLYEDIISSKKPHTSINKNIDEVMRFCQKTGRVIKCNEKKTINRRRHQ